MEPGPFVVRSQWVWPRAGAAPVEPLCKYRFGVHAGH
jgi:hypothetical protein